MRAITAPRTQDTVDTGWERKLWTVDEYHTFADRGLLKPEDRIELIRGELIHRMTQYSPHATAIVLIDHALRSVLKDGCMLRSQLPITLAPHSEPEPDVAVVRGGLRDYEDHHPEPQDVLLVIEVSDTTIVTDRTSKAALYAEFGIPEYWNLNLRDRMLAVCREPVAMPSSPFGFGYRSITLVGEDDSVAPGFRSDAAVLVADLLPRKRVVDT